MSLTTEMSAEDATDDEEELERRELINKQMMENIASERIHLREVEI